MAFPRLQTATATRTTPAAGQTPLTETRHNQKVGRVVGTRLSPDSSGIFFWGGAPDEPMGSDRAYARSEKQRRVSPPGTSRSVPGPTVCRRGPHIEKNSLCFPAWDAKVGVVPLVAGFDGRHGTSAYPRGKQRERERCRVIPDSGRQKTTHRNIPTKNATSIQFRHIPKERQLHGVQRSPPLATYKS